MTKRFSLRSMFWYTTLCGLLALCVRLLFYQPALLLAPVLLFSFVVPAMALMVLLKRREFDRRAFAGKHKGASRLLRVAMVAGSLAVLAFLYQASALLSDVWPYVRRALTDLF